MPTMSMPFASAGKRTHERGLTLVQLLDLERQSFHLRRQNAVVDLRVCEALLNRAQPNAQVVWTTGSAVHGREVLGVR